MDSKLFFIGLIIFLGSCASSNNSSTSSKPKLLDKYTFLLTEIASDPTYGLTEKNPIKVGGAKKSEGPSNERRYLNALSGPNGESISYSRSGSCCHFKTKNGLGGMGLLDNYTVTWQGSKDTVFIYINMYDFEQLKAPTGFGIRK